MNPTPKLRFVERVVPTPEHGENIGRIVKVLQQWFEYDIKYPTKEGEWRDVPCVQE